MKSGSISFHKKLYKHMYPRKNEMTVILQAHAACSTDVVEDLWATDLLVTCDMWRGYLE